MEVMIYTSDPDNVDPAKVATALEAAGFYVRSVDVNEGERGWGECAEATEESHGWLS